MNCFAIRFSIFFKKRKSINHCVRNSRGIRAPILFTYFAVLLSQWEDLTFRADLDNIIHAQSVIALHDKTKNSSRIYIVL
jgi:hypothetical protein